MKWIKDRVKEMSTWSGASLISPVVLVVGYLGADGLRLPSFLPVP